MTRTDDRDRKAPLIIFRNPDLARRWAKDLKRASHRGDCLIKHSLSLEIIARALRYRNFQDLLAACVPHAPEIAWDPGLIVRVRWAIAEQLREVGVRNCEDLANRAVRMPEELSEHWAVRKTLGSKRCRLDHEDSIRRTAARN